MSKYDHAINSKGLPYVQRHIDENYREVSIYTVICDAKEVEEGRKMLAILLHVKKPHKTSSYSKCLTKSKQSMSKSDGHKYEDYYHRMLYVRCGTALCVIVVKPMMERILLRLEQMLSIGAYLMILDPVCRSFWKDVHVIETPHPLLPVASSPTPEIECITRGLVERGPMKSFCIEVEHIRIIHVEFILGCCCHYCDGRYGDDCPASCKRETVMYAPEIHFQLQNPNVSCVLYTSYKLGLTVFEATHLVDEPTMDVLAMAAFFKRALTNHQRFRIMGWYKPELRDGDVLTNSFKIHPSYIDTIGEDLPRYTTPTRDNTPPPPDTE